MPAGEDVGRHVLVWRSLVTGKGSCHMGILRLLFNIKCGVCGDAAPSQVCGGATQRRLLRPQAGSSAARNSTN